MAKAIQMVVYTVLVLVVGSAFGPIAGLGWIYGISAGSAGIVFLAHTALLVRDPSPKRAMKVFGYSITYLTIVFVAMAADILVMEGF